MIGLVPKKANSSREKIFDSAFDTQMEDKQELFVNALINGVQDKETTSLEKLKIC